MLKRNDTFEANLDKFGSAIWIQCDGTKLVKEILDEISQEFPEEKNLDQRLFLFLQQLKALNYLSY